MTLPTTTPEAGADRELATWIRQRRPWLLGVTATVLFLGLALLASLPTGADRPEDAVPRSARLATSDAVAADVHVQVLSQQGRISVQVTYRGPKGWLGARLDDVPDDTVAAWAATGGSGPVPALSVVYGRAPATAIEVVWDDGETTTATAQSDGIFVVARPGRHTSDAVAMRDADGTVVLEVDGP